MKCLLKKWPLLLWMLFPIVCFAQRDTLIYKMGSLLEKKVSMGQANNIERSAYTVDTRLHFNTYFILLASNLKQEFTKPFHLTKKDWGNFGKFAAVTVALGFADEPVQQAALRLKNRNTGMNHVSKYVTNFGGLYEGYTLAGLGVYSLVFKDEKMRNTTLLATQAYITAGALGTVLKFISGRTRPSFYNPGEEAEPRFLGPFSKTSRDADGKKVYSSFPSGHTAVAFAAATVYASEYRNTPMVPIVAYSAASLIGLSRITENKHWSTDVLVGAAIGYLAGKQVVNNYHRFAKIKAGDKKKNTVSFSLNYSLGHWEPGLIYKLY